jgi:hypothetical protein
MTTALILLGFTALTLALGLAMAYREARRSCGNGNHQYCHHVKKQEAVCESGERR